MEPRLNTIIEKAIESQQKKPSKANTVVRTKADERYHKKISHLVSLLTPLIVAPLADGDVLVKYPIEDPEYRLQVQDWIMAITKKHFKL